MVASEFDVSRRLVDEMVNESTGLGAEDSSPSVDGMCDHEASHGVSQDVRKIPDGVRKTHRTQFQCRLMSSNLEK